MDEKEKMIDYEVKIDTTNFPKVLQNIIEELEGYDKNNDWVMYSGVVEGLEAAAKQAMVNGDISNLKYNKILKRYRRYF